MGYVRHRSITLSGCNFSSLSRISAGGPNSTFVSRGATTFDIFRRGVPPAEAVLGESSDSWRRMGGSSVFPAASYRMIQREDLADQK
jgi:hypothetical protein